MENDTCFICGKESAEPHKFMMNKEQHRTQQRLCSKCAKPVIELIKLFNKHEHKFKLYAEGRGE